VPGAKSFVFGGVTRLEELVGALHLVFFNLNILFVKFQI
jgi:hypothetical protein